MNEIPPVKPVKVSAIEVRTKNDYEIFDIIEDLGMGSDFGDLTRRIHKCLDSGSRKIAIRFTSNSYLYTNTLARLVNFYKLISEHKGTLCIIEPNESIRDILDLVGLTGVVMIAASEKDLGVLPTSV